ncbi:hypothetical protein, conserved [Angomonas deanei]|uniref:Uncharacterized protein n=1 Tax=Angomonas deanei TaxID=59799 RepID=A0A7G2C7X9_9TRYP|nr:hypothetical protein, conserved [Angomonas deanei]
MDKNKSFESSNTSQPHNSQFTTQYTQGQNVENSPVRVRYRTKNGSRSPYLAPMPMPVQEAQPIELNSPVRSNNPYNSFSGTSTPLISTPTREGAARFSGRTTPLSSSTPTNREVVRFPDPVEMATTALHHSSLDPSFQLKEDVVHRELSGKCRFIEFPAHLQSANTFDAPTNKEAGLFIGQVRFETTPAQLSWLIQRCCGAVATSFESRGSGCYILYCRSDNDRQLVRSLHKRILFDTSGVWLARTPEEIDALCEYVALNAAVLAKKHRLPRDSMVVEELKEGSSYDSRKAVPPYDQGYGGQRPCYPFVPAPFNQNETYNDNNNPYFHNNYPQQ